MVILDIQCYAGRNIYSHRPVIKAVLDLGELYDTPTRDIGGFNRNLLAAFPGLGRHYCSTGHEGGFGERLEEGTYLAHVTEHLVLELQNQAGSQVRYGKSRLMKAPSTYYIVFEYINEKYAIECLITAVKIIDSLTAGVEPDSGAILDYLRKVAAETGLGPSTQAIFDEAVKRKIPVIQLGNGSILQLGYGKFSRMVEASLTDKPSCISIDVAGNKHLTKQILSSNGIPVPFGEIAYTVQSAAVMASHIGYPVVVKPFDANQGKGVTLNITNEAELSSAFQEAIKFSRAVIVEKYIRGRDYRVLVVGDKVAAVSERKPPCVVGDGIHTVGQLVEIENKNPLRGNDHEMPLTKIKLDNTSKQVLLKNGMDENRIPPAGQTVFLRNNGNLSTGGTASDCTESIHPQNCSLAVKAAGLVGLDIAGIDITTEDISCPLSGENGAVIEINAAPGLRMHIYPTEGKPRNVAADILDMMFPKGKPSSIPIISVTGTNGKTTVTRLISHTLALAGKTVGMTSTSGVYINGECKLKGDNTGPRSAQLVLTDKNVEVAVLETARGGVIRKGLGYDLADVGVVVNISEDHLGIDGIDTLEDMAFVKSLVVEAVKEDGYAILNGDDRMTQYILDRIHSRVVLFTQNPKNLLVINHLKSGGKAVAVESKSIYVLSENKKQFISGIDEIPITFGGLAACNIENSLAAVSALSALNVPVGAIRNGLRTFKPDADSNPGRFNIFDMGNFKVMLDYGHNPAGYTAVIDYISKSDAERLVGIVGMPGDRTDKSIREVGALCGKAFSRVYIKEDGDLRGRMPGEAADILYDSVLGAGLDKDSVEIIYSEEKALETAIQEAKSGDLILMFYEHFEPVLEIIEKYRSEQGQDKEIVEGEAV